MRTKKSIVCILVWSLIFMLGLSGCAGNSGNGSGDKPSEQTGTVDFPTKAITIIVPYSTGGGNDLTARVMADALSKELPQPVIVENVPGASGEVGWNKCYEAKPDGYTIVIVAVPAMVLNPLSGEVGYDYEAFTPLLGVCHDPRLVVVDADSDIYTLEDLLEYAKNNRVILGDSGATGFGHYSGVDFVHQTGIKDYSFVPFDGTGAQMVAVAAGDVTCGVPGASEAKAMFLAGEVRPLCVMWNERVPDYPDVPSTAELGYPDLIHTSSRGFFAPPDTPDEVTEVLIDAMMRAVERDDYKEAEKGIGITRLIVQADDYMDMMKKAFVTYQNIVELEK